MLTIPDEVTDEQSQNPEYIGERQDDPSLKTALLQLQRDCVTLIGLYDATSASYSAGVAGTYSLLDQNGRALILPAKCVVKQVMIYVGTAAVSGGTPNISVGYSGSVQALVANTAHSSFTLDAVLAGVPVSTAATAVALTADTTVQVVIGTGGLSVGKFAVIIDVYELPEGLV